MPKFKLDEKVLGPGERFEMSGRQFVCGTMMVQCNYCNESTNCLEMSNNLAYCGSRECFAKAGLSEGL